MNAYSTNPFFIRAITAETAIESTFELSYDAEARPGQFFELSVPGEGEAPISVSDCEGGCLTITIRRVGRVTTALFAKKSGDTLHLRGPYGNGFDEHLLAHKDVIVIAGGSGLAPVRGLIRRCLDGRIAVASVAVLAGFKSPADILFRSELSEWERRGVLTLTIDKGDSSWQGRTGLVTEHIKTLATLSSSRAHVVVVGPPVMMKFVTLELVRRGVDEKNITVSFERNMSCGLGKCGHCKIDETYVCIDGPVFPFVKARHLID